MMYKALISFTGLVSMDKDEVGAIPDPSIAKDLLKAGYIEAIDEATAPKPTKKQTTTKRKGRKK